MSEPQPEQAASAKRRQFKKQRALNALVFLLATAVCVQAYMLWETNERLNSTVSELNSVKRVADNADWKTIPKSGNPDDTSGISNASRFPSAQPPSLDPFDQLRQRRLDPISKVERMRYELDRLIRQMQLPGDFAPQAGGVSRTAGSLRQMSVENRGDAYVMTAYLPGVNTADVSVRVENQRLLLCVKQEHGVKDDRLGGATQQKRKSGQCTQWVTLPEPVDGTAMKRVFEDGVLTVFIPKSRQSYKGNDLDPSQSVRN